jgi:chromosome transmission fidelity protein 18
MVNTEIATALRTTLPPVLHTLFSPTTHLTELIPLLMRITSPPLKSVNAHIVKPAERVVLDRLVELMIALGLKFWQDKTESGQPMMRLEPAIDVFVHYDGKRADDVAAGRFGVRSVIAAAMDAELAKRRSGETPEESKAESLKGAYGIKKEAEPVKEVVSCSDGVNDRSRRTSLDDRSPKPLL